MDLRKTRIEIGRTIDTHCRRCPFNGGDARDRCELCPIYMKLRHLGDTLLDNGRKNNGQKIERLLAKGRKLTPVEVAHLYELGVDRHDIADALKIPRDRLYRYNDLYIRPLMTERGNERGTAQ